MTWSWMTMFGMIDSQMTFWDTLNTISLLSFILSHNLSALYSGASLKTSKWSLLWAQEKIISYYAPWFSLCWESFKLLCIVTRCSREKITWNADNCQSGIDIWPTLLWSLQSWEFLWLDTYIFQTINSSGKTSSADFGWELSSSHSSVSSHMRPLLHGNKLIRTQSKRRMTLLKQLEMIWAPK